MARRDFGRERRRRLNEQVRHDDYKEKRAIAEHTGGSESFIGRRRKEETPSIMLPDWMNDRSLLPKRPPGK